VLHAEEEAVDAEAAAMVAATGGTVWVLDSEPIVSSITAAVRGKGCVGDDESSS